MKLRPTEFAVLSLIATNPGQKQTEVAEQLGIKRANFVALMDCLETRGLAEFDLAYSNINEKRVEKIWIDLIFDNPGMNQVLLRDLTLTRAPRADI